LSDPEGRQRRRADTVFKTHCAQEGVIVSKCVCMEVKRPAQKVGVRGADLLPLWFSIPRHCASGALNLTSIVESI
jgi:hypothetical protein